MFLTTVPANALLSALPTEITEALGSHLVRVNFDAGEVITEPADTTDDLYFVDQGAVSGMWSEDGIGLEAHLVGSEGCLGAAAWLFPTPLSLRYIAQTPGVCWKIDCRQFQAIAAGSVDIQYVMSRYNAGLQAELAENIVWSSQKPGLQRLAKWFAKLQDRTQQTEFLITQATIGTTLGLQRTTVNEVAKVLAQHGAISYLRGRLKIINRAVLDAHVVLPAPSRSR